MAQEQNANGVSWYESLAKVKNDLRTSRFLPPDLVVSRVVQILVFPSFEEWHSYDVARVKQRREPDRYVLYHTVCDGESNPHAFPGVDGQRAGQREPSVAIARCDLDRDRFHDCCEGLDGIELRPFALSGQMYLDGTGYEFAFGAWPESCRLQWHCEMPASWVRFRDAFDRLYKLLKKASRKAQPLG